MNVRQLSVMATWCSIWLVGAQEEKAPNVHEFRSKSGTKMTAMVMGTDEKGNVLLQPYAPRPVPLESLSAEDQEFVTAEQERLKQEAEFIREGWLNLHYADPGIALLKDSMRLLGRDDKWQPYEPKNVANLRYVAYYITKEYPEDKFISRLSDAYKKIKKRTDAIEVVYISLGTSDKEVRDYIKEKGVEFPVFDPALRGLLAQSHVMTLFKQTYPNLIIVDRQGGEVANSFRGREVNSEMTATLEALEKLVRTASREEAE